MTQMIAAQPGPFTFDPSTTALIVIDMQRDFIEPGGFGESLGNDVSLLAKIVPTVASLLEFARKDGWFVVHTRESHAADLSDCPPAKRLRGAPNARIGDSGPMGRILIRGEPGNAIVSGAEPVEGELVIDKPGKGSFCATDLELIMRTRGIANLVLTGITTDVCVHTTMREANDRGFECLLLEGCCGATDRSNHEHAVKMVKDAGRGLWRRRGLDRAAQTPRCDRPGTI